MVLIAGDISWSLKENDSKYDLDWINELPGKKIISKGNHDYWWGSISKLNKMYENTKFLQIIFILMKIMLYVGLEDGCAQAGINILAKMKKYIPESK